MDSSSLVTTISSFTSFISLLSAIIALVGTITKWINKTPEKDRYHFNKAGIGPFQLKITISKIDFWKTKRLTVKQLAAYYVSLGILILGGIAILWVAHKTVSIQPNGWASRTLIDTKENFLIKTDMAKNLPGEENWVLTPGICKSDLYQNIAKKENMSVFLVMHICSQIGLQMEKKDIKKKIFAGEKLKGRILILSFFCYIIFVFFAISIVSEISVVKKIMDYKES